MCITWLEFGAHLGRFGPNCSPTWPIGWQLGLQLSWVQHNATWGPKFGVFEVANFADSTRHTENMRSLLFPTALIRVRARPCWACLPHLHPNMPTLVAPCWTPIGINFPKRLQDHNFFGFGTWRRDPILEQVLTIPLPHDLPKDIVFVTAGAAAHCGIFSQTDNTGTKAVANPLFSTQCAFALRSAHHVFLIDAQRVPGSFNTDAIFLTRWKSQWACQRNFNQRSALNFHFKVFGRVIPNG